MSYGGLTNPFLDPNADASGLHPAFGANPGAGSPEAFARSQLRPGPRLRVPTQYTYSSVWNQVSEIYKTWSDEAQRNSLTDALAMLRDGFVYDLLCRRIYPVCELPFHLEPDNPADPEQVSICDQLTKLIEATPDFGNFKRSLDWAIWFGLAGVQVVYGKIEIDGKERIAIVEHEPVQGDKIIRRWDREKAILVWGAWDPGEPYRKDLFISDRGKAFLLRDPNFRECFFFHHFEPTDMDWLFEADQAGAIQGYGIRARIYWTWYLRQQVLGWYFDGLQRISTNGMLYAYYPTGNPAEEAAVMDALLNLVRENVAAFPLDPGTQATMQGELIKQIPPSPVAYDVMIRLIEYLDGIMRRCILGQDVGQGTNLTEMAIGREEQNLSQIIRFDAIGLAETFNREVLPPLIRKNKWTYQGSPYYLRNLPFRIRLKFQTESTDVKDKIESAIRLIQAGVAVDLDDLRDLAGLSKPRDMEQFQRQQAAMMGGQAPGGDGQPAVGGNGQPALGPNGAAVNGAPLEAPVAGQAAVQGHPANPPEAAVEAYRDDMAPAGAAGTGVGNGAGLTAAGQLQPLPAMPGWTKGGAQEESKLDPLRPIPAIHEKPRRYRDIGDDTGDSAPPNGSGAAAGGLVIGFSRIPFATLRRAVKSRRANVPQ